MNIDKSLYKYQIADKVISINATIGFLIKVSFTYFKVSFIQELFNEKGRFFYRPNVFTLF